MTETSLKFDEELHSLLVVMANEGVHNAAKGMSDMVGESLDVDSPQIKRVPIKEIPDLLGGPEAEAVGIYLRVEGKIGGQMMMVVPYLKALELVDLMMGSPVGTTQSLGPIERSALQEMGNLTGSFFLNAVAATTGLDARPSPPAVMVDMIGAIIDIILATSDNLSETVLMLQAKFLRNGREAEVDFWIIPDKNTIERMAKGE
ncbi:MAG: chemotaxis protein CheC [Anaerolineales bacterium]|nr:chemotaxis protein CheC [Anaerolineales bacterium]